MTGSYTLPLHHIERLDSSSHLLSDASNDQRDHHSSLLPPLVVTAMVDHPRSPANYLYHESSRIASHHHHSIALHRLAFSSTTIIYATSDSSFLRLVAEWLPRSSDASTRHCLVHIESAYPEAPRIAQSEPACASPDDFTLMCTVLRRSAQCERVVRCEQAVIALTAIYCRIGDWLGRGSPSIFTPLPWLLQLDLL